PTMTRPPRPTLFPYTTLFRSWGSEYVKRTAAKSGTTARMRAAARRRFRWGRIVGRQYCNGGAVRGGRAQGQVAGRRGRRGRESRDRKSTRLNSSHGSISYAVF